MNLRQATLSDYASILAFYEDVIEHTPMMPRFARWQKGKHPTADGIRAFIEEGSMLLYEEGSIVGAMALTMYQGKEYHAIEWLQNVADDEAAVIHILAVSPRRQGEGIGATGQRGSLPP